MGFRLASIAIRHKSRERCLEDLGFEATGETVWGLEADAVGFQSGEWYVVVVNDSSPLRAVVDERLLGRLMGRAQYLLLGVDETAMLSFVAGSAGKQESWSVLHDSDQGRLSLVVEGRPPDELTALYERAKQWQAKDPKGMVDYVFDVPVALFHQSTRYRYDMGEETRNDVLRLASDRNGTGRTAGFAMHIEGRFGIRSPFALQARAAIRAMTPHGGPSTLMLTGPNEDALQIAGGDDRFLVGWRFHDAGVVRHGIAGRKGFFSPGKVKILTNGAYLLAEGNECLATSDVAELATAFLRNEPPPKTFLWRDVSIDPR